LSAVGLPSAYIWGALAFCLNYLPFVGPAVGIALVGATAILFFDQLSYAFLAPAVYFFWIILEGQVVTPLILGRTFELNTVSVFLTVIFWGWLWGIPGALMAVPFLVVIKVICDNVTGLSTFGHFLAARESELTAA
jgi:predicted PurR-regulated permease PerM